MKTLEAVEAGQNQQPAQLKDSNLLGAEPAALQSRIDPWWKMSGLLNHSMALKAQWGKVISGTGFRSPVALMLERQISEIRKDLEALEIQVTGHPLRDEEVILKVTNGRGLQESLTGMESLQMSGFLPKTVKESNDKG